MPSGGGLGICRILRKLNANIPWLSTGRDENPMSEVWSSNAIALAVPENRSKGIGGTNTDAGARCVLGGCKLTDVIGAVDVEAVAAAGGCDA